MSVFNCPVNRRPRGPMLLLAAVAAVAVPGFLVTACSGQVAPAAQDGPASSAATAAATQAPVPRPGSALAAGLLTQAAQAAVLTSYQGEEIVSHWGASGGTVLVSDIWHVSGGQTVTRTLGAGIYSSTEPYLSSDTDGQWPEGVLGVTTQLVRLLETHYVVAYGGAGSAGNRTAQIVEAWRDDGSLAAKFWLDDATKLPLEREVFDSAAHIISEDVFINVRIGNQARLTAPAGGWPIRRGRGPPRFRLASSSPCAPMAGWSRPSFPAASGCSPARRLGPAPEQCSTWAIRMACPWSRCSSNAATWPPSWPAGRRSRWPATSSTPRSRTSGP